MDIKELGFSLAHIGINQENEEQAKKTAALLGELFGFETRETAGSVFVNEQFEVMKMPFRGKLGHLAIRTCNAAAAREYLESKGVVFDEASAAYGEDGKLKLIYARDDIAGFAFHITQIA